MLAGSPEEEDGVADVDDISWSVSRLGADGGSEKHAVVRRQTAVANASRGVTSKRIPRKLEASAQGRRAKGDRSSAHRGLLRIPEHLGMQSGHLGTRTGALGQGRERSDRVSGGVGSGLRFEAFALAA